eukprot:scaffold148644_cov32-Prasinocladus_malaysianus.AAC.1
MNGASGGTDVSGVFVRCNAFIVLAMRSSGSVPAKFTMNKRYGNGLAGIRAERPTLASGGTTARRATGCTPSRTGAPTRESGRTASGTVLVSVSLPAGAS